MGYRFAAANSQYLETNTPPITAVPMSMHVWAYSFTTTATQILVGVANSGSTNTFELALRTGGVLRVALIGAGTSNVDSATGIYVANRWSSFGGTVDGAINQGYANGVQVLSGAAVQTPTGINRMRIGGRATATPGSNFSDGVIAEVAIWDVILSPGEFAALARGVPARLIRSRSLRFYRPLRNDPNAGRLRATGLLDLKGTTGVPVKGSHPLVSRTYRPVPAKASGAALVSGALGTETDTANGGTPSVAGSGATATTTASANAGSPVVTVAGSQAQSTETAFAGTASVTVAGAQAAQTSTAATGSPAVGITGAQAQESSSAFAGTPAVTVSGAQVATTSTAQTGSCAVSLAGAQAAETDTAFTGSISGGTTVAGNQATTTDAANPGSAFVIIAGSQATTTETPQAGFLSVAMGGSLGTVSHTGNAGTLSITVIGSQGDETEIAYGGSATGGAVAVLPRGRVAVVVPPGTHTAATSNGTTTVEMA